MARRRKKTKVQRVIIFIKSVIAFLFSHVGLCAVVVGYAILGAITFRSIELEKEQREQFDVYKNRTRVIEKIWNTTYDVNRLNERQWKHIARTHVLLFQRKVMHAIKEGYDGKEWSEGNHQWTLTGAFLYSLTVITTIGYGNTACKTYFGKTVTIMYAIIGIPLMLLFLTNIGDVLAKSFKFLYSRSLKLKMRLVLWQKRRKQLQLRRANSMVSRLTKTSSRSATTTGGGGSSGGHHHRYRYDLPPDGYGGGGGGAAPNFEELMAARDELTKLEAKLAVEEKLHRVTVPLSIVMLTMFGYMMFGSIMFHVWEKWTMIDSFYFCWVSLATIGFGDLFPGSSTGGDSAAQEKLIITSVYLMLGMALIAMCINIAQEEVVNKIAYVATKLGIVKPDQQDSYA